MAATTLAERDGELLAIDRALGEAAGGRGGVLAIEGPGGIGKSALLHETLGRARGRGMQTFVAYGGQLEAATPWSVARQLLAPAVAGSAVPGLLDDPMMAALPFAPAGAVPEAGFAGLYAMFWLVARLAESGPLLLAVDDAHLIDPPSAHTLGFLARRLAELPVLLLVARRPDPDGGPVSAIASIAGATLLRPKPLGEEAVALLLRDAGADPALAPVCHELTGGSPLLVRDLAFTLATDPPGAGDGDDAHEHVRVAASGGIARAALAQASEAGASGVAFLDALAVLEQADSATIPGLLAGLDASSAAQACDRLCAGGLLVPGPPLRFFHPLAREAVHDAIPAAHRAQLHREAAALLAARGRRGRAASHLLIAGPGSDAAAADILREAAADALRSGDAPTAVELLERALAEPPDPGDRPALLAELGSALARTGRPESVVALAEARDETTDPHARAAVGLAYGTALTWTGRPRKALQVLERALDDLGDGDPGLRARLELEALATTRRSAALQGHSRICIDRLRALVGDGHGVLPRPEQRPVLAALAFDAVGSEPAAVARDLALQALGDGLLLAEEGPESPALSMAIISLWMAEDLDGARAALDPALDAARRQGSVIGFAMLSCWRSHVAWRAGDLVLAEADGVGARELGRELRIPQVVTYASANVGDALLGRGDVQGAATMLDEPLVLPVPGGGDHDQPLLFFRGRLRAAQGRFADALDDLTTCGAGLGAFGASTPVIPWRGEAALAAHGLGDAARARQLAEEGETVARRFGAPGALGAALRARGVVEDDREVLAEAVALLATSPCRLEHAQALADLGAARRRGGEVDAARSTLRDGLDLADACGAVALADRIRGDLLALGARPRRRRIHGPAALTPSELRVAGLAAQGQTNREIAQSLFVTVRTVEMHLSHAYRKLGVDGRGDLAAALDRD